MSGHTPWSEIKRKRDTKPGGTMAGQGNGERDNALKLRRTFYSAADAARDTLRPSPIDLCVCGTKTRTEHGCLCAPLDNPAPEEWSVDERFPRYATVLQETILEEADRLVSDDRREDYGHPLDDFGRVTRMAHALWGRGPETEEEHAIYMILVKLAREANRPKRDNRVDIAGYAKTLDLVIEERKSRFL